MLYATSWSISSPFSPMLQEEIPSETQIFSRGRRERGERAIVHTLFLVLCGPTDGRTEYADGPGGQNLCLRELDTQSADEFLDSKQVGVSLTALLC